MASRPLDHLGQRYERSLDKDTRRRLGAFYTPTALAEELAAGTLDTLDSSARVCDPALGAGALLIAAARVLLARGADPKTLAEHQLAGADIDPGAVDVARRGLRRLLGHEPLRLRVADSLAAGTWAPESFDAVVTNPPFLNQLQVRTARSRADAGTLVDAWGPAAMGYADTANLFMILAVRIVRPDGMVGIILPEPLLAARDAAAARRIVGARTEPHRVWRPGLGAFDAGVRVFVSVLRRSAPADGPWARGEWARVAPSDAPACTVDARGTVGDMAQVTADFRDQYYGVTAIAVDAETGDGAPLVTSGLIDPARMWWGRRPATLARTKMLHPRAAVAHLSPPLQRWARARLVPKVVVATQTRVIEAAVDEQGAWLPVVPVISAVPSPDRLWHLLAVLLAPPVSAVAHRDHTGSALSADAIKLSARQVAALPLPVDDERWDAGAAAAREAMHAGDGDGWRHALQETGERMCAAYGVDTDEVMPWWTERVDRGRKRHPVGS